MIKNNQKIKLVLSFDHELSLGGTSDYQRNIFDPTEKLLELADKVSVPITLFTDILCATRFKQWDYSGFYQPYQEQLQKAIKGNHDVQLHIHPHWIDSDFSEGRFVPSSNYTLAAFSQQKPPNNIYGILEQGVQHLIEICQEADKDYRCIAYRGGGYNLQPNTKEILESLLELGVKIDSTIIKDMQFSSQINSVDFRNMPSKSNWFISPDTGITKNAESGIYEVPIASSPRGFINSLPFLVKRIIHKNKKYNPSGYGIVAQTSTVSNRLSRLFRPSEWSVSFDSHARSAKEILGTLEYYIKQHQNDEIIHCSACSHPKSMGHHQRMVMADFIDKSRDKYGDNIEFVTYEDIHKNIFKEN